MITIGGQRDLAPTLLKSMYDFRHETFVGRLGWSLPLLEGVERDQYDTDSAVYFVVRDADNKVTACARILPTIRRYMLPELFAELLGGQPAPRDPAIWELSRFATSVRKSGTGRVLSLSEPTLNLLATILRFSQKHAVKQLLLVTSVAIERLLLRAAYNVHRAAPPLRMPDGLFVALFIDVPATPVVTDSDCHKNTEGATSSSSRRHSSESTGRIYEHSFCGSV